MEQLIAMRTFLGRRVVMTTLDEIPPRLRALPGCVAMNAREVEAVERNAPGDRATVDELLILVFAEVARDARLAMPKVAKRKRAVGPSTRLAMLRAIL
jgi:hypothetical protein